MTLHFYSPKAYDYIRSTFDNHLPAARTLRAWYSSADCSAGFTASAFSALHERAKDYKANGKEFRIGIILDDMYMRQQSQFDISKKEFLGHDTYGNKIANVSSNEKICTPLSTQVLVLMVTGIDIEFKITMGYFFHTDLSGEEQAALLDEALFRLNAIGVTVVSFTFDGARKNIKALTVLGADYENDQPFFRNPYDKNNIIYAILDVPHMIKLVRNCLGNKQTLYDNNDSEIKWKLLCDLVEYQTSNNLNLGNKLSKKHVEFTSNKMNVLLAVQSISNSSANSLEYLDTHMKNEIFKNSQATVTYIRTFNNLFDIMNAKRNHSKGGYKRPFSEETITEFMTFFSQSRDYIKGLKVEEDGRIIPILKSRSFTPFFGFMHNMTSFVKIYYDYIKSGEFYPFRVSQDLLESYFGCVRRMGSTNDNPTAQQFSGAYRKLLFQNEVSCSQKSNCQNDITQILTVSSRKKNNSKPTNSEELQMLQSYDLNDLFFSDEISDEVGFLFEGEKEPIQALKKSSLAYLSGIIEAKIIQKISRKSKNACQKCMDVFTENELTDDSFMEFLSDKSRQILQPCKSTVKIICLVEKYLERIQTVNASFNSVTSHLLSNINLPELYIGSEWNGDDHDHKYELVKQIIQEYLDYKSIIFSKSLTTLSQKKLIRHDRLKEIHRSGQ